MMGPTERLRSPARPDVTPVCTWLESESVITYVTYWRNLPLNIPRTGALSYRNYTVRYAVHFMNSTHIELLFPFVLQIHDSFPSAIFYNCILPFMQNLLCDKSKSSPESLILFYDSVHSLVLYPQKMITYLGVLLKFNRIA